MREIQQSGRVLLAYQGLCLPLLQSESDQKMVATQDAWSTVPVVPAKRYDMFTCLLPGHSEVQDLPDFVALPRMRYACPLRQEMFHRNAAS